MNRHGILWLVGAMVVLGLIVGLLGQPAAAATYTWDASGGSPLNDGAGNWSPAGGTNWYDNTALTYGAWGNTNADTAIFGVGSGAAGTITVGAVTANAVTFNAPGSGTYALSGGSITLAGTTPTITVNTSSASIASVLTGSAGMKKDGAGTLVLTGSNNYTAGTAIGAVTLQIGNGSVNGTIGSGAYSVAGSAKLFLNYGTAAAPT